MGGKGSGALCPRSYHDRLAAYLTNQGTLRFNACGCSLGSGAFLVNWGMTVGGSNLSNDQERCSSSEEELEQYRMCSDALSTAGLVVHPVTIKL